MPHDLNWFSVVDLKDAFWSCPLATESRDFFAFEWEENNNTDGKSCLRFIESPNLFIQILEKYCRPVRPPHRLNYSNM
jgi:hypothetical protein